METIVHHTAIDTGDPDKIEREAPFRAKQNTFLGEGYYFWDYNEEVAHVWGKLHYNDEYVILESKLNTQGFKYLDLAGSRIDQKKFESLITELAISDLPMAGIIQALRKLSKQDAYKAVFDYDIVRAIDMKKSTYWRNKIKFVEKLRAYTTLNPVYIICVYSVEQSGLEGLKIIYPESYCE